MGEGQDEEEEVLVEEAVDEEGNGKGMSTGKKPGSSR